MNTESELSRLKLHFEDLPDTIDWGKHLRNQRRRAAYHLRKCRQHIATAALSVFVKD